MILIPFVALFVGVLLGWLAVGTPIRGEAGLYIAVACLAGLDTVCGGIKSSFDNRFQADVFVTGFISNVLLAFLLAWLGDKIGANLFLVGVLIFGQRIFNNLSLIRRHLLTKYSDWKKRRSDQADPAQIAPSAQ